MRYTEEEIRDLQQFAALYGYVLELTERRNGEENAPENRSPAAEVIHVAAEALLSSWDRKAS